MTKSMKKAISLCLFSMGAVGLMAQSNEFKIDVQKTGAPIQSTMYGIFFEDINFGADGGLYAELIKNRSFEFENPFGGWMPFGNVSVQTKNPCFDRNPHYVRLSYEKELTGTGLDNEGFKGIGIREGEKYDFSLYARTQSGMPVKLRINLVDSRNDLYEQKEIEVSGKEWKKYTVVLTPGVTEARSRLRITMATKGTVDLEHISLFPQKTFNNRPNGMRADLAQALKDLKPGVFRFPGGCIVEGTNKATRYQWKNTIGPVENRPININRWNYTFSHKKFPDYYQSYGLGFFEYFQLSEDIGAEPLPVLNCGLSCQYENQDPNENCPVDKLQPYIDDALDLIEFANGPVTSKWGKIRADMGHPAPFNLKLIAIGNEQWGPLYPERLEPFIKAILTALCEAAFMTGFERNADVVHLCTYAPLFAHVDAWQWRPDLIWFDNLSLVKTPNYYVQQLYGHNAGTNVVPLTMQDEPVTGQQDLYATAAVDKHSDELIIKVANTGIRNKRIKLNLNGLSAGKHKGTLTLLHSSDLEAKNTLCNPSAVVPVVSDIEMEAPQMDVNLKPLSFSVYRIKL